MPILDQFDLHGRRALVTGGSRGLGVEMGSVLVLDGGKLLW